MEDNDLKAVREFLRERGFFVTEFALQEEQTRFKTINHPGVSRSRLPFEGPLRFQDAYDSLRTWVHGSLQPYKEELHRVLYPVFVKCFVDLVEGGNTDDAGIFFNSFLKDHEKEHSRDLHKMKCILSPNSQQMDLAKSLKCEKFRVELCEYSYELLLRYLHKEQALVILEVMNKGIIFEVSTGQPSISAAAPDCAPFFPLNREVVADMIMTGSASALIGITGLNVIVSKVSECREIGIVTEAILSSIPYTYLPVGLISAALAVGATRNHRLLGAASFFFIAQLLYIFLIGGVRTMACGDPKVIAFLGPGTMTFFFTLYCIVIPLACGLISGYPKCLHRCAVHLVTIPKLLRRMLGRAAQSEESSEADVEMGIVGRNRDQLGPLASGRSKKQ